MKPLEKLEQSVLMSKERRRAELVVHLDALCDFTEGPGLLDATVDAGWSDASPQCSDRVPD
jgi:hypothetical protein